MKAIYKLSVIFLLLTIVSCDPTRVDSPPLGPTEESYFSSAADFRGTIVGCYAKINDYYFYNANGGNWVMGTWYLPGDDLTESQGSRTAEELFDGTLNPTNVRLNWIFDKTYEIITKTNVVIEKVQSVDFSAFDGADEIAMMEGEALFLRSYAYFNLFNIFGNVPVILKRPATQEETNVPKSDKLEVLDQVIIDAETAISSLPESWEAQYAGRATKNSARALLIKALVFRSNYTKNTADLTQAITVFNSISGVELRTRFLDNFDAQLENNSEALFEIQSSNPTAINNIFLYNDGPWGGVENMSIYRGMMTPSGKGQASNSASTRFLITDKLFNGFGTDPRISYFLRDDDNENGKLFQKYTLDELDQRMDPFGSSVNNERVLRLAGIKLLVAEALLKTGNAAGAIAQINEVRTRAREWGLDSGESDGVSPANRPTSESDAATIMQWIMDERFVELAGEGHRWWDLKRWHVAGDIDLTGWTGADEHFSTSLSSGLAFDVDKHLLSPIPQTEIERNSAIIANNPGY
jgi:starch-binding outer membrane protein, SusD/RagB family